MDGRPPQHPRGLYTLFFTEMWERFSYYGMRALLVLFMVDQIQHGGLGFSDEVATAIYGLYTAAVYLAALPGGWVADRLLGAQRAVLTGGCLIATGHFALAVPRTPFFFLGLLLVVLGTGLLKPNVSTLVGQLYPEGGARRDAGFTLFYMGINLGAALGPLCCSSLGEKINWHYGFAAAGLGMVAGLVQFRLTRHHLGDAGRCAPQPTQSPRRVWIGLGVIFAVAAGFVLLAFAGLVTINPLWLARRTTVAIVGLAAAYFAAVFLFGRLEVVEKKRLVVILILFLAAALFWSGYEQAGSSLNLFAERYTERVVAGFEIPAGWFQSLPAVFVIGFAPVAAALWLRMSRRGRNPSLVVKLSWGLILLGLGFLVLVGGAKRALAHGTVWPTWLIFTYLLHVFGELLLSPVGLSSVTKLAPARLGGQMMGVWFLAASLGNLLAGLLAGQVSGTNAAAMPAQFLHVAFIAGAAGLLLLACARPVRRPHGGSQLMNPPPFLIGARGAITRRLCLAFTVWIQWVVLQAQPVIPVPPEIRDRFQLPPFYQKYLDAGGLPVVGSTQVSDFALREAVWIVQHLLGGREHVLRAMATNRTRLAVMAWNEFTTDIPEHAGLKPRIYWDRRARGLGATPEAPAVSCAEENLLGFPGDPYSTENICIHEFAHAIHEMGLSSLDPTFDPRLAAAFHNATNRGLWKGTYASSNRQEYWAEGVQSWFDDNRENDALHNHVNTRAELKGYDPGLAELCREVFGDGPWRYHKPALREAADCEHLAGFNPAKSPRFRWRTEAVSTRPRVLIQTALGDIEVELDTRAAPVTVTNFLRYTQEGLYADGRFFRTVTAANQPTNAVKIAVIQAQANPAKTNEYFASIPLERTRDTGLKHLDGTISMARDGPDTAQNDFFICIGDQPELDFGGRRNPDGQGFAAFGRVVKGMDVVRQIHASAARDQQLDPPVRIQRAIRME